MKRGIILLLLFLVAACTTIQDVDTNDNVTPQEETKPLAQKEAVACEHSYCKDNLMYTCEGKQIAHCGKGGTCIEKEGRATCEYPEREKKKQEEQTCTSRCLTAQTGVMCDRNDQLLFNCTVGTACQLVEKEATCVVTHDCKERCSGDIAITCTPQGKEKKELCEAPNDCVEKNGKAGCGNVCRESCDGQFKVTCTSEGKETREECDSDQECAVQSNKAVCV